MYNDVSIHRPPLANSTIDRLRVSTGDTKIGKVSTAMMILGAGIYLGGTASRGSQEPLNYAKACLPPMENRFGLFNDTLDFARRDGDRCSLLTRRLERTEEGRAENHLFTRASRGARRMRRDIRGEPRKKETRGEAKNDESCQLREEEASERSRRRSRRRRRRRRRRRLRSWRYPDERNGKKKAQESDLEQIPRVTRAEAPRQSVIHSRCRGSCRRDS